jgi:hypothetical protein
MPVLVEQYVVVGGDPELKQAAELWRFGPKAFKGYFNIPDPAAIQQAADKDVPIDKVIDNWAIGTNPETHIAKIRELRESGVTIVNIHAGQADQKRVVEFYGSKVLPEVARS